MRATRTSFVISSLCVNTALFGCVNQTPLAEERVESSVSEALAAGAKVAVGPEIGTDRAVAMPTTLGSYPALASDGNGFLTIESVGGRIRGQRVDANGTVLDLDWLDFGVANYEQYYSDVTFGAGHYLVAWDQSLDGGTDGSIQGRFVKPDGTLEGAANFQLSSGDGLYPSLAWDGTHFIAAWLDFSATPTSIRFALFNADGSKVSGSEKAVSNTGSVTNPRVAAGTNYSLVTWEEYEPNSFNGLYKTQGVRVDKVGAIADDPPLSIGSGIYATRSAAVASSGSRFLVAWSTTDSPEVVRGSVIGDTGTIIKNDFAISHSSGSAVIPTVDFDGTNFAVAWADARDNASSVYGVTVSPEGTVNGTTDKQLTSGGPRYVMSGASDRVNIAYNGTRHLVNYLGDGVEASLLDESLGIVKDDFNVTSLPGKQGYPRMVWDGTNYVVGWTDESDPDFTKSTVRTVRISNAGKVLDPDGILVTAPDTYAWSVALTSAGKQSSLFVYANVGDDPLMRSLASNGTLGSSKPFGTTEGVPRIVSNGTTYLATYATGDSSNGAVFARLLDANATVGAEIRLDSSTVNTGPSAVPLKDGYLVSYAESGTRVVTVSNTGTVGTSMPLQTGYTSIAGDCSGDETLVAWDDDADGQIHARFFKDEAWSGSAFVVNESTTSNNGYPTVVWDGTSYYIAWEIADADYRNHQLLGRSVSTAGVLGPVQTLVSDDTSGPVLASDGQGQMLLSYLKWIANSNSRRIYSRILTPSGGNGSAGAGNAGAGGQSGSDTQVIAGGTSSVTTAANGGNGNAPGSTNQGGSGASTVTHVSGTTSAANGGSTNQTTKTSTPPSTGGAGTTSESTDPDPGEGACSIQAGGSRSNAFGWLVAVTFAASALRRTRRRNQ